MVTKYAVVSGPWSAIATWDDADGGAGGDAVPADGDAVVVSAGVTLTVDVDQGATGLNWSTGVAGIIVRGGATPGMLAFKNDADGIYCLRIKTGTTISGTTVTNRGRLFMAGGSWASPSDAPFGRKMCIDLLGTASIDPTNLDRNILCTNPTNTYCKVKTPTVTVSSVSVANNEITATGHGLVANLPIVFIAAAGAVMPAPLLTETIYYVKVRTSDDVFTVSALSGGTAIDITSTGSGTITVYGGVLTGETVVPIDRDLTGDTNGWLPSANVVIAGKQRGQLASSALTNGSLTFSSAISNTLIPDTLIVLEDRNVSILYGGTGTVITTGGAACTTKCLIKQTSSTNQGKAFVGGTSYVIDGVVSGFTTVMDGSGYTFNGVAVCTSINVGAACAYGTTATLSASSVVCGFNTCLSNGTHIAHGLIASCASAAYQASGIVFDGEVLNCGAGFSSGSLGQGCTIGGLIRRCGTAVELYRSRISATIKGCTIGLTVQGCVFSGIIEGCVSGVSGCISLTISGTIKNCTSGIGGNNSYAQGGSGVLRGGILSGNTYDFRGPPVNWLGWGASLKSSTQASNYSGGNGYSNICMYDICDASDVVQPGQVKAWMGGGTAISEAAPASPPVALDFAHKMTGESATYYVFLDFPIYAPAGVPLTITIYEKCNANPSTFTTGPKFQLLSQNYLPDDAAAILDEETALTAGDDTSWHTITLTYTPTNDEQVVLRSIARDATKYYHWAIGAFPIPPTDAAIAAATWARAQRTLTQ